MSLPTINQKEYLKKYLSLGSDDKKKKKRKKVTRAERFQVVDDDIDLKNMQPVEGSDYNLYELAEDAPLVVGFVDERPEELKALELFRNSKWKIIQDEHGIEDIKVREENVTTNKKSTANTTDNEVVPSVSNRYDAKHTKYKADKRTSPGVDSGNYSKTYDDSDVSPPRKSHGAADSDESPPRVARDHRKSPKRSHRELPKDLMRKKESSPPRKSKHDLMGRSRPNYYDSDESPPRKSRAKGDSDDPVPRRSRFHESSDESPPRKSRFKEDSDDSRGRSRNKYKHSSGRSHKHEKMHVKSMPTSRRDQIESDESPPRRVEISQRVKPSRWSNRESGDEEKSAVLATKSKNNKGSNTKRVEKQETTLEGKKAGLQDSNELRIENMQHHLREKEMFSKMGDELSGRNATTIVRDRATGKKRDLTREAEEKEAEREKENEKKEKYSKWGRGLKQVEEHQSRLVEDLYEMSKPLARYADDEDLEKHLKEQEREGDPMQEYIRSNKMKKDKENKGKGGEAKEKYPVYQGPQPPPNRFGIRPGYRWDGVDRSTGYEQKWFQEQNSRKALQEEAYKWSTEDM